MQPHRYRQTVSLIVIGIAAAVVMGVVAAQMPDTSEAPSKSPSGSPNDVARANSPPSLDCAFNAIMHSSGVVYFYFDVALSYGEPPRFYERAFVSADGTRRTYGGGDRPPWTFSLDGGGQPTIKAPDGTTQIILYGLKLGSPGEMSVEAGLRSDEFRNLGGICRQSNLAGRDS